MIQEHRQKSTATWWAYYPAHEPRADDPHKSLFEAARKAMIDSGQGCWRCADRRNLEAHHAILEFAVLNGIDLRKLTKDFPSIVDTESLYAWAAGPGNLEILCRECHRGQCGIHSVPWPAWSWQRYALDGIQSVSPGR